jgi:hypothetical protein
VPAVRAVGAPFCCHYAVLDGEDDEQEDMKMSKDVQ